MTPDQLMLVKSAIQSGNRNAILIAVGLFIFNTIFWLYLERAKRYLEKKGENLATKEDIKDITYNQKKGENLATKEDVGRITEEIKSVETSFGKELEAHKAMLASLSHYNQLRYSNETKIFRQLWKKIYDFVRIYEQFRGYTYSIPPNEQGIYSTISKLETVAKDINNFIWQTRPFYPQPIWEEIRMLSNFFSIKVREGIALPNWDNLDVAIKNKLNEEEDMDKRVERVSNAIRKRLTEFD